MMLKALLFNPEKDFLSKLISYRKATFNPVTDLDAVLDMIEGNLCTNSILMFLEITYLMILFFKNRVRWE